jgi:hypothetical protein
VRVGLQVPSYTWRPGPAQIAPTLDEVARTHVLANLAASRPGWMPSLFRLAHAGRTTTPDPGGAK